MEDLSGGGSCVLMISSFHNKFSNSLHLIAVVDHDYLTRPEINKISLHPSAYIEKKKKGKFIFLFKSYFKGSLSFYVVPIF
jgi:hypothetical protein